MAIFSLTGGGSLKVAHQALVQARVGMWVETFNKLKLASFLTWKNLWRDSNPQHWGGSDLKSLTLIFFSCHDQTTKCIQSKCQND
jgi:hypothetical protein